jgi:hypothetical protein
MALEREQLHMHAQNLADELSKIANKPVKVKLAQDADSASTTAEATDEIELVLDASVFQQIQDEERALTIWRGLGVRALARLEQSSDVEALLSSAGTQVTELHQLLEDAKRLANTRKKDPNIYKCLASLAQFESRLDTNLKGYPGLLSKFRYLLMTNIPLQSVPARVAAALDVARVNICDFDSIQLVDLAERIHECLAPKPKADISLVDLQDLESKPDGFESVEQFATAEAAAEWLETQISGYLEPGVFGIDKNDKRFGQLEMLQASLRVDCLEALPLRVQEENLDKVMEIIQSVFFVCRAIDELLKGEKG